MTRLVVLNFLRLLYLVNDEKSIYAPICKMLHTILRGYPQTSDNFSENTDNISKN